MQQDRASALQLLDKILTNEVEVLSKDEAEFLIRHKDVCSRKLLPILALEVALIKEGENWNPFKLHGSLKLLAAFEEKKAFDWVIQLHGFPETLNGEEGFFIPLFWADILVATLSNEWNTLLGTIDNPEISDDIREACIDALLILVSQGRLDRALVVDHFQSLYTKAIAGEVYDPELLVFLIEASLSLWPGESIEEIKELFGLGLINEDLIRLPEILVAFEEGKEECLAHLQSWTPHSHLLDFFIQEAGNSEEISFEFEVDETPFEEEADPLELQDKKIAYLLPSLEIDKLTVKEQKKYQSLPKLLVETPEKVIEIVSKMIDSHPNIPVLFHYYHSALILLDAKVLAMEVVKEWVRRFPDDLLGKIEYAHYFLRRGEPQHVDEIFSNTWSLMALYPERESFHELECLKFFHLVGLYLLQREEIEEAEEQLNILDTINPSSFEYHHLKRKLSFHLQGDFFVEDL
jgi:hypothetical protein